MAAFWVLGNLVEVYQRFRGTCCHHHHLDEDDDNDDGGRKYL
jgi:hypothetical protein